jgi:hypothetical protein
MRVVTRYISDSGAEFTNALDAEIDDLACIATKKIENDTDLYSEDADCNAISDGQQLVSFMKKNIELVVSMISYIKVD